jgi:hypothetical protein
MTTSETRSILLALCATDRVHCQAESGVLTIHCQMAILFIHTDTPGALLRRGEGDGLAFNGPLRHFPQHDSLQLTLRGKLDFIPAINV